MFLAQLDFSKSPTWFILVKAQLDFTMRLSQLDARPELEVGAARNGVVEK